MVCCLPNAQTLIITRLRRRPDAEAHLRILQQLNPSTIYRILFDVSEDPSPQDDRPKPIASMPSASNPHLTQPS